MSYTKIAAIFADAADLDGKEVTVGGWVRTIRDMKGFGFIELNDGSCFKNLQIVMDSAVLDNYKDIAAQNVGAALIVTGAIKLTPEAKQPLELKAAHIAVEGTSTPDYPLQKKRHSVEFLRTIQHLRPRTNLFSAAFRVRSVAAHAIHCFFQDQGFVYVHTPIITGSDCEGAGEMFQVTTLDMNNPPRLEDGSIDYSQDFFGKPTSLTVSGQLNCENFAMAFGNVYTFGPTFRAENSNTQRHAAEFWMVEPEMAFADLNDYMDNAEAMIKYVIKTVLEKCPDEINFFNSFVDKGLKERLEHVASSDFGRISYTEAVEILEKNNDKFDLRSTGAATCRRSTSVTSPNRSTKSPSSSPTIPRRSRPSICALTTTARPSPPPTAWFPASVRSSAAASVKSVWSCWRAASRSWAWTPRATGGTVTCAAMAPASTPASAWASSVW